MSAYSVVIPAHDAGRYVADAVESARRQVPEPSEVIVVDDRSTDDTAERAKAAGATVVANSRAQGASGARNHGIAAASAHVVAFLDADDTWLPGHAASLLPLLERDQRAVLAFGGMRRVAPGCEPLVLPVPFARGPIPDAAVTLLGTNPVPQSAVFVRRSVLLEVGGYDESVRLAEDYDLWLRVATRGELVYSGTATLDYRVHDAQTSGSKPLAMLESAWAIRSRRMTPHLAGARAQVSLALRAALEADVDAAVYSGDRAQLRFLRTVSRKLVREVGDPQIGAVTGDAGTFRRLVLDARTYGRMLHTMLKTGK